MAKNWSGGSPDRKGILVRLRRDKRGNVLAIMSAALIPLIGFSGSAIDMARLYVVRVRLQQACDAGVLAGRKVMSDTSMTTDLDIDAKTQAQAFFSNNIPQGWFQTTALTFKPVKASNGSDPSVANAVTGTATATVPMSLMQFFGVKPFTLNVACQAVYDMADSDVMFVLDTTGSMSCKPSDPNTCANAVTSYNRADGTVGYYNQESSGSKLASLRNAVTIFDSTMRANADKSTRFRYGFVTYSSAVNVGYSIPSGYLQNNFKYQSRYVLSDYNSGSPSSFTYTNVAQSTCQPQRNPAAGYARSGFTWTDQGYYQARNYYNISWRSANGGTCSGTQQPLRPLWRYDQTTFDTSKWGAGQTVINPSRIDGSTGKWRGCIEELNTKTGTNFDVTDLPDDLDPDVKPTDASNRWRPLWPDVVWNRSSLGYEDVKDENVDEGSPNSAYYNRNYGSGGVYDKNGSAACGMPAQRLKVWTAQQVKDYLNDPDFKPYGGTYHDVGMIWGTRMLSPDGVFAADTAAWPGRKAPSRIIVFMTDGAMAPSQLSYGQYGVELWDNRTGGQSDSGTDYNNHTARFRIECDAAKKKGFTVYVVALGTSLTNDLTYCASPGQAFQATSDAALSGYFKTIAQRIAMLRITQ